LTTKGTKNNEILEMYKTAHKTHMEEKQKLLVEILMLKNENLELQRLLLDWETHAPVGKYGHINTSVQERYLTLVCNEKGFVLQYSKRDITPTKKIDMVKGVINLSGATVWKNDSTSFSIKEKRNFPLRDKTFRFLCKNEHQLETWINKITEAIKVSTK